MRVGIDTGGTFTDLVTADGRVVKVPSTGDEPALAVRDALDAVVAGLGDGDGDGDRPPELPELLAHGTTVATNALLQRRLGRVALVTNRGFADVIEIARQARPSLYDAHVDRPAPLVDRSLRYEVGGRVDGFGREVEPFDGEVPTIDAGVDAVAVCLLHADLDAEHERAVAARLRERGARNVTCSHEVSPEFREYERMVTTVADAALQSLCRTYLQALVPLAREVLVMTSAGGLVPVLDAADHPASLLLSGPAAGVRAAAAIAVACGFPDAVAFDMGGTSTDVCLVQGGVPAPSSTRVVAGFPIRLPALAVHTIGAGGGSIAALDAGGALAVGPQSAGAHPGPACYGRGGEQPTVTDADLLLGRIPADAAFAGLGRLDADAARNALVRAGVSAEGVVSVVDAAMERAVRVVTVEQGVDPRDLALVAFGGAGPLHACAVADALGMPAVIVPPRAGVFSAVGLVSSPRERELVRTWATPSSLAGLTAARRALADRARDAVGGFRRNESAGDSVDSVDSAGDSVDSVDSAGDSVDSAGDSVVESFVDCRYRGQSHELTVREPVDFPAEHERRNGFARADAPIEVVALRARATRPAPLRIEDLPVVERATVAGPQVVVEPDCTVWIPAGWTAHPGPTGAWVLRRS